MIWQFFNNLWNSITAAGGYTIEFFQNIGRAVGGALGDFFSNLIHAVLDLGVLVMILFEVSKNIFLALLKPVLWIFTFLYQFFSNIINFNFTYQSSISLDSRVMTVINAIPAFSTLSLVIVVAFYILILFKIFKLLTA